MKTASSPLINLLESENEYAMVDTFTFTLADGTVIVYTSGDPPSSGLPLGDESEATLT